MYVHIFNHLNLVCLEKIKSGKKYKNKLQFSSSVSLDNKSFLIENDVDIVLVIVLNSPPMYTSYRRDRADVRGGVIIITKKS